MKAFNRRIAVLLMCLFAAAALTFTGCGGDVTANTGTEYKTMWFKFTVNSIETETSYGGYTAAGGNQLLVANVTITNSLSDQQSFGTWDFWYVSSDVFRHNEDLPLYYPMSPLEDTALINDHMAASGVTVLNTQMMPDNFFLSPGDSATYDIVIEFPANMPSPHFIFTEIDEDSRIYKSFKYPI
ncbi:MAG: DUF4352 domain-containing protein [Coriobacteriia bacterium]|nr:DUF4352 domain-containing protein [Coriobacteriia bacterium]MCL2750484.1 DUF4352 domain-containing protein [Coriobacteriia bacterium]